MSDHDGDFQPIRSGIYTVGYFGTCSCGWTGGEQPRPPRAILDHFYHLLNIAEWSTS
ncbi:hypothetical protein UFOVP1183_25 [uncultured Caudovirales phage]|uniref:Uncharacterized protein n=1 Tax=uncultured Caudovirales phage TaxID=2100421 RepID=A0A6J5QLQ6_9CAUD|nr:hypothetical protein UFOVP955_7 [uncultured Caudovirales phage]CAB4185293.1 hypothetical protein UFOVP1120_31 [uncultured Caudovirales phage]CAB4188338.1 hypothetical protein UFOVP1183_25 [uncultured Caudovirales phage]CAB4191007.1 hypothetical protein UFOVP1227_8 [uncultured Caudovirales phage]CAB5229946.1 hypothetical protein UFOVP1571_31 [uncultured Caudovirales phage]